MGHAMDHHRASANKQAAQAAASTRVRKAQLPGLAPAQVLLVAVWTGLIVGFLDLGLMILKKRLAGDGFYRLGGDFAWLIPLSVGVLVLLPGIALATVAWVLRRTIPRSAGLGLLFCVGFIDLCARLPIELWAALLLSCGLAVQLGRLASVCRQPFLTLVRRTTPLLSGALLAILSFTLARQSWSEYRAMSALPSPATDLPNVLLIVWDTVRAKNLSLHGYARRTSPNLERLAARGIRFDRAFATAPWTLPSHASLFTGRWPHELTAGWRVPLDGTYPTLAEYLSAHGYDTAGFVANLDFCSRETGLSRGFAHYEDYPLETWDAFSRYTGIGSRLDVITPASVINRILKRFRGRTYDVTPRAKEHAKTAMAIDSSFLAWLTAQQARHRPFFAYLNYNDAHSPYEISDRSTPAFGLRATSYVDRLTMKSWETLDKAQLSIGHVQMATDIYDDSISYLDRRLGVLLAELEKRGVLDNTLLILAADHGEHLGDHLLFLHGCSLYRQLVHVPLVVVPPSGARAGRIVSEPVSLREIPATVVDLLGLAGNAPFPGRSLGRFWTTGERAQVARGEPLLMETEKLPGLINQGREPAARGSMSSLVLEGMHYIRTADGREELYLLDADPEERFNLAANSVGTEALKRMRAALESTLRHGQDRSGGANPAGSRPGLTDRPNAAGSIAAPRARLSPAQTSRRDTIAGQAVERRPQP
jgi:arylsulfatase A-like enzyme